MLYFKNSELSYTYHVSVRTVRNWIEAVKQGKLDLDLHTHAGRQYVSNTARNIATIERMVEDRKKYRPHRAVKTVTPRPEFYKLYNESQIYDIVSNLEIHHEIPHQYNYFDGGAEYWDAYARRLMEEETPNLLTSTIRLLEINQYYINELISKYERVNVIDIGVGNALPVKKFLSDIIDQGKLGRYMAIDISPDMLKIAERNVKAWFGDECIFEDYAYDINHERFTNILAEEYLSASADKTVNIILFLGGTIENLRDQNGAYRTIHDSMGLNDLFIQVVKLDTHAARHYFDFNIGSRQQVLPLQEKLIVDLLNIDEAFYTVEMGYDERKRERYMRIRLNVALTVEFEFGNLGKRSIVLNKDDTVMLWRYWHQNGLEVVRQLDKNKFHQLQASETNDEEYLLTISRISKGIA